MTNHSGYPENTIQWPNYQNSLQPRKEKDHNIVTMSGSQAVANLGLGNFLSWPCSKATEHCSESSRTRMASRILSSMGQSPVSRHSRLHPYPDGTQWRKGHVEKGSRFTQQKESCADVQGNLGSRPTAAMNKWGNVGGGLPSQRLHFLRLNALNLRLIPVLKINYPMYQNKQQNFTDS